MFACSRFKPHVLLLAPIAMVAWTACTSTNPCAEGWSRDSDGNCSIIDEKQPPDSGHSTDSGEPILDPCRLPDDRAEDPLTDLGVYDNIPSSQTMIELVDVSIDPDRDLLWGVGQGGLIAFDISDSMSPSLLSMSPSDGFGRYHHVLPLPSSDPGGGLVYVTHRSHGLSVFDVTESSRPVEGSRLVEAHLEAMFQLEDWLYVAGRNGVVHRFDISNRSTPVRHDTLTGLGISQDITGDSSALYVADQEQGLVVIDASNPQALSISERHDIGAVNALSLNDSLVVAAGTTGVTIFSRENPIALEELASIDLGTIVMDVVLDEDLVWAVTQERVHVLSVKQPDAPRSFASRTTPYWAMTVDADSGVSWVGDWGAIRAYEADSQILSADIDLEISELLLSEDGGQATFAIANRGNDSLFIEAMGSEDARMTLSSPSGTEVPRNGSIPITVEFSGGALDSTLCFLSNDPDDPVSEVRVHTGGATHPDIGKTAPDFTLQDVDGVEYTLSDFQGHPVVISYFATW